MSGPYARVQELVEMARAAVSRGERESGGALYREAAWMEWAHVVGLPAGRPRTVALFGVDALEHFALAGDVGMVRTVAAALILQEDLKPYSHRMVCDLLLAAVEGRAGGADVA